ncbi:MAG: hypothetical protein ACHQRK_11320 [Gemmatimonadales bacterium]
MTSAQTQQTNLTTWRVEIDDRADVIFQLRDYLRRMGVQAAVCAPTALELETDTSVNDLRRFVADWNRVTAITARLVEGPAIRIESGAPRPEPTGPRLGELLVAKHLIDEEQLLFALNEARETGDLLGIVLLRKQLIFEDELARTLSDQLSIPYVSVMRTGVDRHIVRLMPADVGERAAAIPVRAIDDAVEVAFADPTDPNALAAVRAHLPNIRIAVSELSDIRLAWRHVQQRAR